MNGYKLGKLFFSALTIAGLVMLVTIAGPINSVTDTKNVDISTALGILTLPVSVITAPYFFCVRSIYIALHEIPKNKRTVGIFWCFLFGPVASFGLVTSIKAYLNNKADVLKKTRTLQICNFLILLAIIAEGLLLFIDPDFFTSFYKPTLVIIFVALIVYSITLYKIRKQFFPKP